jgi:hypothetical protein
LEAQLSQCLEHKEETKPSSSFPQIFVLLKKVEVQEKTKVI